MEPTATDVFIATKLGPSLGAALLVMVGGTLALSAILGLIVYIIH